MPNRQSTLAHLTYIATLSEGTAQVFRLDIIAMGRQTTQSLMTSSLRPTQYAVTVLLSPPCDAKRNVTFLSLS